MLYRSTRSEAPALAAEQALLEGLAPDGGLFVPQEFPSLGQELLGPKVLPYPELAGEILSPFFPAFPRAELRTALEASAGRFSTPEVAPLVHVGDRYFLELFRGPTLAFKDLALTLFGPLLAMARRATGIDEELLVLVATSGDTGKAALAGLEAAEGVRVVVFYPAEGVSAIQRLQMTSHAAENALVLGLEGNFDDAQRGVKTLFSDPAERVYLASRGLRPSSANSINIGRLLPQIVYYVSAYRALRAQGALAEGEAMDVAVPTGNFGDVLAAWYAKRMGLPIERFIVASNRNRVLADFLATGRYDRNRPFHRTTSPSMDILVSSNLERLIFEATGRDTVRTAALMASLARAGAYELSSTERAFLADFIGGSADEDEAAREIRRTFEESGYLLDTHTATAAALLRRLRDREGLSRPTVIAATASPFKFPGAVASALDLVAGPDELATAEVLAASAKLSLPPQISALRTARERHRRVVGPAEMQAALHAWLEEAER